MSAIRYFSVCSGIEAISVAVEPLGWQPVGFAEIDAAASRVLAHRYGSNLPGEPLASNGVPNHGDFTQIDLAKLGPVDVLVGGTPCQAFSIAGKRLSLDDARGNLTLAFVVLAHELARSHGLRNAWWENVPGVLNTPDNAFGCFLGAIVGADDALHTPDGEGWPNAGMVAGPRARLAWRVLDAQYFGLAQRRKRVFVVADFGNGADPATVLFERKSRERHSPPSRKAREGIAPTLSARTKGGGGLGTDFDCDGGLIAADIAPTLNAHFGDKQGLENQHIDGGCGMFIAHSLRGEGFDASEDGTGSGTPIVPVCFQSKASPSQSMNPSEVAPTMDVGKCDGLAVAFAIQAGALRENPASGPDGVGVQADISYTLEARAEVQAVAFDLRGREGGAQFEGPHDTANIRAASGGSSRSYVAQRWAVRRLTPRECERLQGFPDDWTLTPDARGKPQADGPRYKQLGNSMAVNVVGWIAQRLDAALKASHDQT